MNELTPPASGAEERTLLAVPPRYWSRARLMAVQLVAEGDLSHAAIAAQVRKSETWLHECKRHPAFMARVDELRAELASRMADDGVLNKNRRLHSLLDDYEATETIRRERAASLEMQNVPGGRTGFVLRQLRLVKVYNFDEDSPIALYSAKRDIEVYEYVTDTALLKTRADLRKEIAAEKGEIPKVEGPKGDTFNDNRTQVLIRQVVGYDPARLG